MYTSGPGYQSMPQPGMFMHPPPGQMMPPPQQFGAPMQMAPQPMQTMQQPMQVATPTIVNVQLQQQPQQQQFAQQQQQQVQQPQQQQQHVPQQGNGQVAPASPPAFQQSQAGQQYGGNLQALGRQQVGVHAGGPVTRGGVSILTERQMKEAEQREKVEIKLRSEIESIQSIAEKMFTIITTDPWSILKQGDTSIDDIKNKKAGVTAASVLPKPGTKQATTYATLNKMHMDLGKIVQELNLGGKHLMADQGFLSSLISSFDRVTQLMDEIAAIGLEEVPTGCCGSGPAKTQGGYGGSHSISVICTKIKDITKKVKADMNLTLDISGNVGAQGSVGHQLTLDTESNQVLSETGTRHEVLSQGQTVVMADR